MPKRTFWLITGAAVGAGSSLWVERRVRRTVQEAAARLQPDALVAEVGRTARQAAEVASDRVRDAMAVGRVEMRQHEERLWQELAERGVEPPAVRGPDGLPVRGPDGLDRTGQLDDVVPDAEPVRRRPRGRPTRPTIPGDTAVEVVDRRARNRSRSRRSERRARRDQTGAASGPAKSPSHLDN
ncbi:MAG: hypothetical protein ACLP2J_03865 [Acidimicrobiales bacterium]